MLFCVRIKENNLILWGDKQVWISVNYSCKLHSSYKRVPFFFAITGYKWVCVEYKVCMRRTKIKRTINLRFRFETKMSDRKTANGWVVCYLFTIHIENIIYLGIVWKQPTSGICSVHYCLVGTGVSNCISFFIFAMFSLQVISKNVGNEIVHTFEFHQPAETYGSETLTMAKLEENFQILTLINWLGDATERVLLYSFFDYKYTRTLCIPERCFDCHL